jgi:hypothetical protein
MGGGGVERVAPGAGVVGADSIPEGIRPERIRGVGPRFGGAIASEAAELGLDGGGGGPLGDDTEGGVKLAAADCGRDGGGGGGVGLAASAPA